MGQAQGAEILQANGSISTGNEKGGAMRNLWARVKGLAYRLLQTLIWEARRLGL